MKHLLVSSAILPLLLWFTACATVQREPKMAAFYQACVDATTDAVVLNLAAHPDDEAARTLVYLRRKHGLRTYTLYSTCGGGGQNAIGRAIGEDLARIRARETLAAAKITGTQVRWMGFADFGYSKTAEETFRVWGKNNCLDTLDRALNKIGPDVIFTNHGPDRGHGHHRATSICARELVAKRPGLLLYERMRWRRPRPAKGTASAPTNASTPAVPTPDAVFPVGEIDPSMGESYAHEAMRGWRMHRTQGMGAVGAWRRRADTWKQILPAVANKRPFHPEALPSLFDSKEFLAYARENGISPDRLREDLDAFGRNRSIALQVYCAKRLLPDLWRLRAGWQVPDSPSARWNPVGRHQVAARLERRIDALERVILEGLRIKVLVSPDSEQVAVGGWAELTLRVWSPEVELDNVRLWPLGDTPVSAAKDVPTAPKTADHLWETTVSTAALVPKNPSYVWPAILRPTISFTVDGLEIFRQPRVLLTWVPRAALSWQPGMVMLLAPKRTEQREVALQVEWNGRGELDSTVEFDVPPGVRVRAEPARVKLSAAQRTASLRATLTLDPTTRGNLQVVARLKPNGSDNGGLGEATAKLDISAVELRQPRDLRIGLIRGPDDTLNQAFLDLQLDFQVLDPVTLKATDLTRFTTLVIDIRAYRTRRDLVEQRDRILEFCRDGGRVVCFYHQPGEWNARENRPLLAPYPLRVGRKRVSQEDAPAKFLDPGHRLWNHPNKITAADFDGWVQERGLNFPERWGKQWVPMLEMADKGEKPLLGGLLYGDSGEGQYIYCSLALYRQLRQGHAGAARILMNLVSP
ncbi:MAG: PIG-L family deacetylase [Planctomycetota bacterium]